MAWVRLHDTARDHPKFAELATLLQVEYPVALGHACLLWLWTLNNAPTGDLSKVKPAHIAFGAKYKGDPVAFVKALKQAGLIDKKGHINDWMENGVGQLWKARKRMQKVRAERAKVERKKPAKAAQPVGATA